MQNNKPKISEVYYNEIGDNVISAEECGDFYFLHNLLNHDDAINKAYEKYFENIMHIKNDMIGRLKEDKVFPRDPKINESGIMISSLKNRAVLLVEY